MLTTSMRRHWLLGAIVQATVGLGLGVFEATGGAYFFDCFSTVVGTSIAIVLTTTLLAFRHGLIAFLEVPAGALADSIGRVNVVIMSFALRVGFFLFLAALALSGSVAGVLFFGIIASLFWSFSYTFFTGSFSAWCVDRLREVGPDVSVAWLVSRLQSHYLGATTLGAAMGIIFYIYNLPAVAYLVLALITFTCMGLCIRWMKEPATLKYLKHSEISYKKILDRIKEIISRGIAICRLKRVLFWLILTFGTYMALLNLVMFLWPIYFKESLITEHVGFRWLVLSVTMVGLRAISARALVFINNRWEKSNGFVTYRRGFRWVMMVTSVLVAICIIGLGLTVYAGWDSMIIMAATVSVVCIGFGFMLTSYETLINVYISKHEAQERATIISAGSMFRSVLAMVIAVASGGTSAQNLPIYWAIPAVLLVISAFGAFFAMVKQDEPKIDVTDKALVSESA